MSDDSGKTKKLSLSSDKLTLGAIDPSKLRAGPAVGAGRKTVQVEVRRKRAPAAPSRTQTPAAVEAPAAVPMATPAATLAPANSSSDDRLTAQERAARVRALKEGLKKPAARTQSEYTALAGGTAASTTHQAAGSRQQHAPSSNVWQSLQSTNATAGYRS